MIQKINYGLMLDKKISELQNSGIRPRLLLHSCCAPCSSYVLEYLHDYFDITLFFFNPNISPAEEYEYRKSELKRLVQEMQLDVDIIDGDYVPDKFYELSKGLENLPERGERCRRCIGFRLDAAGQTASEVNADFFTTTLTISPHKDAAFINQYGGYAAEVCKVPYLFSDFKKHDGYKRSIELSHKYQLYRQNYCGCIFSKNVANK